MPTRPDDDDEALSWEGDDENLPPRPSRVASSRSAAAADGPADEPNGVPASGTGLVALGVLGGAYLLITIGWVHGVQVGALASGVSAGSGTAVEIIGYVSALITRGLAVAAAPLWFALAAWRFTGVRRFAWLLLGAVLLLPWPALVHV